MAGEFIGEFAVWLGVVPTDEEVAELAAGADPRTIAPEGLLFFEATE